MTIVRGREKDGNEELSTFNDHVGSTTSADIFHGCREICEICRVQAVSCTKDIFGEVDSFLYFVDGDDSFAAGDVSALGYQLASNIVNDILHRTIIALNPTPPSPQTITVSSLPGFTRFRIAPAPVCTPQPRGAKSLSSSSFLIRSFTGRTVDSLTTLSFAKLE